MLIKCYPWNHRVRRIHSGLTFCNYLNNFRSGQFCYIDHRSVRRIDILTKTFDTSSEKEIKEINALPKSIREKIYEKQFVSLSYIVITDESCNKYIVNEYDYINEADKCMNDLEKLGTRINELLGDDIYE